MKNDVIFEMMLPDMLRSDLLADRNCIKHGFFTRVGGVSAGLYDSLNCGYGSSDAPENVTENRVRAKFVLGHGTGDLLTCNQIHSAEVISVETPWKQDSAPEVDGMVTTRSGIVLGILTADCAPVLFADPENRVIAAAHAGWKGALGGITDRTIAMMLSSGAEREKIIAAVGPAISQESYEVDAPFRARFAAADPATKTFFIRGKKGGKFQFDLTAYIAARLEQAKITQISTSSRDTYSEEACFFSYRRSVHKGEPDYGRALSMIALAPER